MSAVEVPAELLASWAKSLDACWEAEVTSAVIGDVAGQIRALLPQPAPTCPNCGHADDRHDEFGCQHAMAVSTSPYPVEVCPCVITPAALPQVRALLAAERDGKPAPAPGSVESFTAHAQALGADFDAVRRAVATGE